MNPARNVNDRIFSWLERIDRPPKWATRRRKHRRVWHTVWVAIISLPLFLGAVILSPFMVAQTPWFYTGSFGQAMIMMLVFMLGLWAWVVYGSWRHFPKYEESLDRYNAEHSS
jgi:hypothetical protein